MEELTGENSLFGGRRLQDGCLLSPACVSERLWVAEGQSHAFQLPAHVVVGPTYLTSALQKERKLQTVKER